MTTAPERSRSGGSAKRVEGVLPKPTPDIEVGVSANLPFVTPYKSAWEVLRDEDITVRQLVAMRRTDGQARALYRLMTLPIRAALKGATFVPESHVDGGEDEAAFVEQMFTLPASGGGMTVPFNRIVSQLLMALFDGFAAFEMVYWSPVEGPLKSKWTLKKIANRPADTLTFLVDDTNDFAGFRQQTMFQGRHIDVQLPKEHCFYYAANEEERPFYGRSYFESAYYHWDKKYKLYAIAHIAAQRAAVGTRIGKLPQNPNLEEKTRFRQALADLAVAQFMTIPQNYEVESLKEAVGFDFLAYINHHNSQMSKSILAGFFDKEQGGGDAGKLVDFGTQSDALFMMMLQTIMGEIEDVINQKIIPRFVDWNFNSGKYPLFQFGSLSEDDKSAVLDLYKQLATSGQSLVSRPEFFHELEVQVSEQLGLEIDWEAVEDTMAEEEEQAALMEQQAMAASLDPNAAAGVNGSSPAGAAPAGGGAQAPVVAGHAQIPASTIPDGFTLSNTGDGREELTSLAAQLLDDAYQTIELVRGKPNSGGPKFVRTAQGSKTYGVPIGAAITRDLRRKTAKEGVKGKQYGGQNDRKHDTKPTSATSAQPKPGTGDTNTRQQVLGGGPGAKADLGGVATDPNHELTHARHVYTNPNAPGAKLIDYGDGTVALMDAQGRLSPRQKFNVGLFAKFGWKVDDAESPGGSAPAKTTAKKKPTGK